LHVKKSLVEAEKWYRMAAKGPYGDGRLGNHRAQLRLGEMYEFGQGVKQDYAKAVMWYRAAANLWDAEAQFKLGTMYAQGRGVQKNQAESISWFRKAAGQGHVKSQTKLGLIYVEGTSIKQDYGKAIIWFRKAAQQNDTGAQYMLGIMNDNGLGVKRNAAVAVRWLRKAAKNGYASAQFYLGVLYSNGRGVMKSSTVATDWFYKAGLTFLNEGNREKALTSAEKIKAQGNVPNAFLGNKLLALIYSEKEKTPKPHKTKKQSVSTGTGWPITAGYIVTNHHVIAGHHTITLVRKDGIQIKATVAADDIKNDLSLLKPESLKDIPPALPMVSSPVQVGEGVFTVGYPHPDLMGIEPKLTQGIVNARTGIANDPRTYQISVPLQGGNSGGPLINMHGEVLGVVASKLSAAKVLKWTGDLPQNVNYAIKSEYILTLVSSIDTPHSIPVLSAKKATLPELAKRVEDSVLMIIAQ